MNDWYNDPPEEPESPECCGEEMCVKEDGTAFCETCGGEVEPCSWDEEPETETKTPREKRLESGIKSFVHAFAGDAFDGAGNSLQSAIGELAQYLEPHPDDEKYETRVHLDFHVSPPEPPAKCPHGNKWHECNACFAASDFAYDASRGK